MNVRSISLAGVTLVATNALSVSVANAAEPAAAPVQTIVVTATRVEQSSFDLPVSIDVIDKSHLQDQQLQVNLSESLARVPGIVAQNRQNYAQDLQISSRGFGARSTFGVRGIRMYADGIPATMPDGQGQISHFDIGSAGRVEVLRGPFSALYGNSSGGVISIFTEDGKPGASLEADAAFGSDGTRRGQLKASGQRGGLNYVLDASDFRTDGYRDHSAAERKTYNGKLRFKLDDASTLTFVVNDMNTPEAQDPLGLTRGQYNQNPRQAGDNAVTYNARKYIDQHQIGLNYERRLSPSDTIASTFYYGRRDTVQFQAITAAIQAGTEGISLARNPGGIIDLARNYGGVDLRWTHRASMAGGPAQVTVGVNYENVDEVRKGFNNFTGPFTAPLSLGEYGALRRNEDNRVFNFDQYIQGQWEPSERWLILAGVRNSTVKVDSHDNYVVPGNIDDSGSVRYSATNPAAGITFKASNAVNIYASYGQGFETPTTNELSYRSSNGSIPGLNFGLKASKSDHYEVGAKAILSSDVRVNAALFQVKTQDEIATLSNTSGRSVFQNVPGTKRDGFELSIDAPWGRGFGFVAAYTYLRATYSERFLTCAGSGCSVANTPVAAGSSIPGIPRSTVFGELSWKDTASGFASAIEVRHSTNIYVNDLNTDAAEAYTVANIRFGFEQGFGGWKLKEFARIDNLTDRKYAGSVIVNESNGRYFESAPGRAHLLGISAAYQF
jgi:iron complex outermembrane receptor protein